jgi:hypothetical protein
LGKGFFRGVFNLEASVFDVSAIMDDPLGKEFKTNLGVGLDLGLRYTYRGNFAAAIVCYDVYSPVLITTYPTVTDFTDKTGVSTTGHSTVDRRLDFGLKYRIRSPFIDRYISALTLMADYRDFLDLFALIPRNPILNVGMGMEVTVLNALSFRFGVTDALPSFGLGLDLSFVILDFAIRGKELGIDPGLQPTYALDLSLLFRY